jgi:hypothetical protein
LRFRLTVSLLRCLDSSSRSRLRLSLAAALLPVVPDLLNFSCRVHCLYLLFGFFHGAGLGFLGCRGRCCRSFGGALLPMPGGLLILTHCKNPLLWYCNHVDWLCGWWTISSSHGRFAMAIFTDRSRCRGSIVGRSIGWPCSFDSSGLRHSCAAAVEGSLEMGVATDVLPTPVVCRSTSHLVEPISSSCC